MLHGAKRPPELFLNFDLADAIKVTVYGQGQEMGFAREDQTVFHEHGGKKLSYKDWGLLYAQEKVLRE